jgi:hypothetical protein
LSVSVTEPVFMLPPSIDPPHSLRPPKPGRI